MSESVIKKNRNVTIDCLKALGIMVVIFGHVKAKWIDVLPFWNLAINASNMALFFILSGYCSYNSTRKNDFKWLKKRFKFLIIPYFAWVIIKMYSSYRFDPHDCFEYLKKVFRTPDAGFWYLFVLFEFSLILTVTNIIIEYLKLDKLDFLIYGLITLVLFICFWKLYIQILGMYLMQRYIFFFFAGYLLKKYAFFEKFANIVNNKMCYVLIVVVALPFLLQYRGVDKGIFIDFFNMNVGNVHLQSLFLVFMRYIVQILGISFSYVLIKNIPMVIKNKMALLGQHTIEVYLLENHFYFDFSNNPIIDLPLRFITALGISIFIVYLFEKGLVTKILFGKDSAKVNV